MPGRWNNFLAAEVQRITEASALEHLLALAANHGASPEARALARAKALSLRSWMSAKVISTPEEKAARTAAIARIEAFEKDTGKFTPASSPTTPPGQPIGDEE